MAATINPRDIQILGTTPRMVGVGLPPNIVVNPDNVDGLGLVLNGIKRIWISATSQIFQIAKNDTVSPASITLTANVRNLTTTPTLTIVPGSGTMSVIPALTAGIFSFTAEQLTSDTITLRLSLTEDSVTYTDDFTFVKVREGDDSLNGYLTNESHTVPADYLGNVTNYNGASGTFNLLLGTLDARTVSTFAVAPGGNPDGLTVAITASGSNAGNYVVTGGFPANKDTVTITFNATFGTTVFPKVLTLTKSKAGQDGTVGIRGSRQFYVGLSGSTATWSDVLAASAASADGGPVLNDQVTQYNNSVGFSQTKFWNGSVWVTVDAVIDGNLLVTGTVGASKVVINASVGSNVWFDPNYADYAAWQQGFSGPLPLRVIRTDGISGGTVMQSPGGVGASALGAFRTPVVVGKKYRVSVKARKGNAADGLFYFRLDVGNTKTGTYSDTIIGLEGITSLSTSWQEYSVVWTATASFAAPYVLLNFLGTTGYMEAQDIRIEEMNAAGLVVQGGIVADQIDSRGLSIRDSSGNIILAAGNALPIGYAASGTVNADLVPSINAAQTAANNAALSAANAQASANTANTALVAIGSDSVLSKGEKPQVVQDWLTVDSERSGIVAQANTYGIVTERDNYNVAWGNLNSYLSGLSPAYNDTSQDTPINGASFRLYWVQLYDARQILLNKIADEAGKRAVWANVGGSGRPADNATVGATIGVDLNGQITSGNASTYIANAAIGSAQIGTINANQVNASSLSAITATIGTLRTATSGGRTEISDNIIKVFDASGTIRVKIGNLAL